MAPRKIKVPKLLRICYDWHLEPVIIDVDAIPQHSQPPEEQMHIELDDGEEVVLTQQEVAQILQQLENEMEQQQDDDDDSDEDDSDEEWDPVNHAPVLQPASDNEDEDLFIP